VMLIANSLNVGFAVANNQGLRLSRGRYLLLNSDAVPQPGALAALVAFMGTTRRLASSARGCCTLTARSSLPVIPLQAWLRS
jgi:GT2 family glycosyltransferase